MRFSRRPPTSAPSFSPAVFRPLADRTPYPGRDLAERAVRLVDQYAPGGLADIAAIAVTTGPDTATVTAAHLCPDTAQITERLNGWRRALGPGLQTEQTVPEVLTITAQLRPELVFTVQVATEVGRAAQPGPRIDLTPVLADGPGFPEQLAALYLRAAALAGGQPDLRAAVDVRVLLAQAAGQNTELVHQAVSTFGFYRHASAGWRRAPDGFDALAALDAAQSRILAQTRRSDAAAAARFRFQTIAALRQIADYVANPVYLGPGR